MLNIYSTLITAGSQHLVQLGVAGLHCRVDRREISTRRPLLFAPPVQLLKLYAHIFPRKHVQCIVENDNIHMYRSLLNTCTFSSARLGVLFPSNCLCTSLPNTCAIPHLSNSATNRNTCSRNRSSHNNNRGAKFKCPAKSRV